jgi:predicted GH43/DUF377 family glycosyl hydrolase
MIAFLSNFGQKQNLKNLNLKEMANFMLKNLLFPRYCFVFLLIVFPYFCPLLALRDLSQLAQNFVLETKQIHIPGYPDAFNPTIIRYNSSTILLFRIRDPFTTATNQMGAILLDKDFNPIGFPQKVKIPISDLNLKPMTQDPKLFQLNNELYMAYNDMISLPGVEQNRRMFIAKLRFNEEGSILQVEESYPILHFEGKNSHRQEKNWSPFVWNEKMFLVYSLLPHRILNYHSSLLKSETIANTTGSIKWSWGELRGGTPAEVVDEENLSFFHSCKHMCTVQSEGKYIPHYFMGAYTFSKEPPFEITKISPEPIFGKDFYTGPTHKTWTPLRVVFPGGFIRDKKYIWVVYGKQDHEIWIVKLDKEGLYQSLHPITTLK